MKDIKYRLIVNTIKNMDEMIYSEVSKSMKELCLDIEKKEEKGNEKNKKRQIEQIKNRNKEIRKVFVSFDKCMNIINQAEYIERFNSYDKKENEIDKKIAQKIEESLLNLSDNLDSEEEKKHVSNRISELKILLENFDKNILKIERMKMQQTKLGYLALAEGR